MRTRILQLLLIVSLLSSGKIYAQIRIANTVTTSAATNSSAFIDASSSISYNGSENVGKGLLFPRTDLTIFSEMSPISGGMSTNYPTRYDGMIVYNSASGTAAMGGTAVTPGFYYYSNPGTHSLAEGHSNQGTWVRLDGSNAAQDVYYGVLSTNSPSESDIQGLSSATLLSGDYRETINVASTSSEGYFTVAIPVSWRNPLLTIEGDDTWNIILPLSKVTINNIEYQIWQTDVAIPSGKAIAIL